MQDISAFTVAEVANAIRHPRLATQSSSYEISDGLLIVAVRKIRLALKSAELQTGT
jgi:hypothetical protein